VKFRLVDRSEIGLDHELIWSSVTVLVLVAGVMLIVLPRAGVLFTACPFKAVTGYPCASCGATRSFMALLKGDLVTSFAMNPLFAAIYVAAGAFTLYGLVVVAFGLPRLRLTVSARRLRLALAICVPAAVCANWIYLIWAGI